MKEYKHCQSCGMPLCKDPKGSGTNADGQPSNKYCSYCYEDGKFLQPDITAEEMQEFCEKETQRNGKVYETICRILHERNPKIRTLEKVISICLKLFYFNYCY